MEMDAGMLCCIISIVMAIGQILMWVMVFQKGLKGKVNKDGGELVIGDRHTIEELNDIKNQETKNVKQLHSEISNLRKINEQLLNRLGFSNSGKIDLAAGSMPPAAPPMPVDKPLIRNRPETKKETAEPIQKPPSHHDEIKKAVLKRRKDLGEDD